MCQQMNVVAIVVTIYIKNDDKFNEENPEKP